jgi:hypothetical protein
MVFSDPKLQVYKDSYIYIYYVYYGMSTIGIAKKYQDKFLYILYEI